MHSHLWENKIHFPAHFLKPYPSADRENYRILAIEVTTPFIWNLILTEE